MTGKDTKKIFFILVLILVLTGQVLAASERAIIIMDADTGQVLHLENPKIAVETAFPTGSLIKPFSALYGLKENIISPFTTVHCEGNFNIQGETLQCWLHSGHGTLNFYKAMAYSCNVYFYHYGNRFDTGGFLHFLRSCGFGGKTGIDLPNEHAGVFPAALDTLEKIKTAAGGSRTLQITPIQAITAFAALVNGGKLLQPFLSKGKTIVKEDLNLASQLPILHRALQEASTYGTSAGFFQESGGFAKTGTAPWLEGYHTHAWLAGYVPIGDKKIVILVFVLNGTGGKDALPIGIELVKKLKQQARDQQPIKVSLFSLLKPRSINLQGRFASLLLNTGVGEEDQETRCRSVAVKHISPGNIKIRADNVEKGTMQSLNIRSSHPEGFLTLRVNNLEDRDYCGSFIIRSKGDYLEIINTITLREYLLGVIGNEMAGNIEAQKCQAILSRTYALKNLKRHGEFDFCDTTHCQHYTGRLINSNPRRGVEETVGLVLTYNNNLCDVFYHSTCGGFTNDYKGVWGDEGVDYLKGIDDHERCRLSPHYRWQFEIEKNRLLEILEDITGNTPVDLRIGETGSGGWIKQVVVIFANGKEKVLRGEEFHIHMGRCLGWNTIKSSNFILQKNDKIWLFLGKGLGHGVGLCQWGARALAEKGLGYQEILNVYFPGTKVDQYWSAVINHE